MSGVAFENIKVGDQLPPLTKNITQVGMVEYCAATWDFARVHYDKDYVTSRGMKTPMVDGQMLGAYVAQIVMDWMGGAGTLKKLSFQVRKMVIPGDTLTFKGTVTEKRSDNGQKLVTCDISSENQNGERVVSPASVLISF
ncbi:MAG: hypothetical protein HYX79_01015 [Chloroflexi bacterium]|nr:hypothetical protein [Chloroflexota bacterium]